MHIRQSKINHSILQKRYRDEDSDKKDYSIAALELSQQNEVMASDT